MTEKVFSLLANTHVQRAPARQVTKPEPEPHPLEGVLKRVVDRNLSQMLEEAEGRASTSEKLVEEQRLAREAAEARAAAHEATLAQERQERLHAVAEAERRYSEANAAMEAQRLDWERQANEEREQRETAMAEAERLRKEAHALRTAPRPEPVAPAVTVPSVPDRFEVIPVRDAADLMRGLVLHVGQQRIEVDIRRDGTGKWRQLSLSQKQSLNKEAL